VNQQVNHDSIKVSIKIGDLVSGASGEGYWFIFKEKMVYFLTKETLICSHLLFNLSFDKLYV
jgi:hypothetical protein